MDDLISRQQAIDAIDEISCEVDDGDGFDYAKWREYFCELPSAQLATDTNVGIKLNTNLAEVGTDLISRQAAIDALDGEITITGRANATAVKGYVNLVKDRLERPPSAQPKTGKWILDRSGAYCCSQCMEPCAGYVMMKPRDKFCKMCGSRNEVTE